jgi:CBS-domain-containing membrane protein
MSLDKYTQARLVVQRPDTSAYDAIRAMEDNHIGAVIVYGEDEVLGIVTDRDLAVRVLGEDLEPREIPLEDVMSSPVSVLPPTATEADAARLMLENHVRRIPLVDGARLVGLVTLDDLASEQAIDAPTLAAIVRAQLSDRSRHERAGPIRPTQEGHVVDSTQTSGEQRHAARAAMSYHRLLGLVEAATRLNVRLPREMRDIFPPQAPT